MPEQTGADWATVARETFEFSVIPWAGRPYADWVRAWSRPHPGDPRGLMQLPQEVYATFQQRVPGQRMSSKTAPAVVYPRVPGESDLERVRKELHEALGRCDWEEAHDLDEELRSLQVRVAATRVTAYRHSAIGAHG